MATNKLQKQTAETPATRNVESLEAMPDFMAEMEIDQSELNPDDLRLPRLAIAQAMSPQMTPGKPEFNEDLRLYDLFNDLTGEIYGKGPLKFIPIHRESKRIEFDPNDSKIVVDDNVPYDDPRNEWGPRDPATGKGTPPRATKFVNFVVLLMTEEKMMPEPVVISIRQSNKHYRRTAERLTGFIEAKKTLGVVMKSGDKAINVKLPTYGAFYSVDVKSATMEKGTFGVFNFEQAGIVTDRNLFSGAKQLAEQIKGKTIVITHETAGEVPDDANFDTAAMDRDAAAAQAGTGSTPGSM